MKIYGKQLFHLLIGFSLIVGIFYLRALPKISRDLYHDFTDKQLFWTCFSLACIAVNLYHLAKLLKIIETKNATGILKTLNNFLEIFVDYLEFTLKNAYHFCWYWLEKAVGAVNKKRSLLHYHTIRLIAKSCITNDNSMYYFYILMCIKFIPTIVFLSIFVTEVFFYKHLDLTFKCIPFLLIPFLERVFLFMLKDFHRLYYTRVASLIEIKDGVVMENAQYRFAFGITAENNFFQPKSFKDYLINHYLVIRLIPTFYERYSEWKNTVFPGYYLKIFLQSVRLQIYIFILFYGLNLIS